ncbi:zinc-dependent metalloprotease [uncultured Rikenella sp.]|uniref:zinc-dependent metalloprotease n=1 Tax=uncultured Rikenella sp. TaxID=368003 RepID=UPI00261A09B7|nr:zinc-dependent metalloprotease [uncultured Rikenella sp.]
MNRVWIVALAAWIGIGMPEKAQGTEPAAKAKTEQNTGKKTAPVKKRRKGIDTTAVKPAAPKGSIAAVIKPGAKRTDGLFTVFEQEGRYYFLIPNSLMGRDMLVVNRISKAAADMRNGFFGYAGDPVGENMIRFRQSPDKKRLFVENISTRELPRDTTGDMYRAVIRSNMQPIVASFEIKAASKAKDSVLVDATDFIGGDVELTGFDNYFKANMNIGGFQKDKSYIVGVKAFPENVEMKSTRSYLITPKSNFPGYKPSPMPATYEINSSLILLPEVPMQPRWFDPRVGYFTDRYIDYDKNPQGIKNIQMITRWRLEPKPEDVEAYRRGELVEPAKPIVYYIDPATPKKWVPYLIAGVNDWQAAFEQAGFKNAIVAKVAPTPEEDSTWSLEDARNSAIVYKPSNVANASGPHVSDPRTGEILESHINWYHNVMNLLRNWYMIQAAPSDTGARRMVFDDALMGDLIRFVSSHEVGHTLGLRHNFGSSSLTPVDSLRSASFLEKNGHTASIMDYARFNYVAQPEDGIRRELLYPRIGDYDKWAIEWGYRRFPDLTSPEAEADTLNRWIIGRLEGNPRLWFGTEINPDDPREQNEDLGDNQMRANELGIRNLKVVLAGIPEWTRTPNEGYDNLETLYTEVVSQFKRYNGHVAKWVGGIYETPKTVEQAGPVYAYVEKAKQKEAMAFLDRNLFTTPVWLIDEDIYGKIGLNGPEVIASVQAAGLKALLSNRVLENLIKAETAQGREAYTVTDLFGDLNRSVWRELSTGAAPDVYRRGLQTLYTDRLLSLLPKPGTTALNDVPARVTYELRTLQNRLKGARSSDPAVKAHYQYLAKKIGDTLDPK